MEFTNPIVRRLVVTDGTRSVTIDTIGSLAQILFELVGVDIGRLSVDSNVTPADFVIDGIFNGNNYTRIRFVPGSNFIQFIATDGTASHDAYLYLQANAHARLSRSLVSTDNAGGSIPESWHDASLQNSWVNFGAGYPNAGYRFMPDGTVLLRGPIKNGTTTAGTTIFNLPAAYRPATVFQSGLLRGDGPNNKFLELTTDGNVKLYNAAGTTVFNLDGIRFPLSI